MRDIVVLAEDDAITGLSVKQIINAYQPEIKFIIKGNGEEALNYFKEHEADLLITDISMPKLNGISLIKELRKLEKKFPIVVCSAYTLDQYKKETEGIQIEEWYTKPLTVSEIKSLIDKYINLD